MVKVNFIGDVVRGQGLPNSVGLNLSTSVGVSVTPDPITGHFVKFVVINTGGGNGSASITAPANGQWTTGNTITVHGDAQTDPGHAGNLKIRALCDGNQNQQIGADSNGVSVCAYPNGITMTYAGLIAGGPLPPPFGPAWGARYVATPSSDSGNAAHLDKAWMSEDIHITNSTGLFASSQSSTSGFLPCTAPQTDHHFIADSLGALDLQNLMNQPGSLPAREDGEQLFRFACDRCGIAQAAGGPIIPHSGFGYSKVLRKDTKYWIDNQKQSQTNRGADGGTCPDSGLKSDEIK